MVGKQPAISLTCILRASIRVVDAAPRRLPGSGGSLQRCNRQACIDRTADRISDHSARPGVEDGGQVDEAGGDCDLGDVRHPELVRAADDPVTRKIRKDRIVVIAVGRGHKPPPALGLQVVLPRTDTTGWVLPSPVLTWYS